jgi:hypothetical protein
MKIQYSFRSLLQLEAKVIIQAGPVLCMEAQVTKAAAILEARPNLRPWYFFRKV